MKFLCIGYGSIGQRHSSILRTLGHEVTTVDPAPGAGADYAAVVDIWPRVAHSSNIKAATARLKSECEREGRLAYEVEDFNAILDCTPPDIRAGWNVPAKARFIEKPLGQLPHPGEVSALAAPVMLGFCYRHLPSLKMFILELADVRVFSLSLASGQWLPDWHDDDYRLHYHGTPGRGGIILDSLPHSLFIARWILGDVRYVGSVTAKLSGLDIRTEDTAAVLLEAPTGQPVYILADYLRKPRTFYIEAVTSGGVRHWEFDPDEADAMYTRQMEVFCALCTGERRYDYPDLAEGVAVQRLLERCLEEEWENAA